MPTVLIIGGGIAGAAAALALGKAAIDATIYEAHPLNSHDRGAFLTLASNGMHALRQLDADAVISAVSAPLGTMRVCSGEGAEIATVPLGDTHDPAIGYRYLTRANLCSALQREAKSRRPELRRHWYSDSADTGLSRSTRGFSRVRAAGSRRRRRPTPWRSVSARGPPWRRTGSC
jgi:2-polyprenyl-6-methoxyphenol hydroxylase-like FAD-dependent oxidoreductase